LDILLDTANFPDSHRRISVTSNQNTSHFFGEVSARDLYERSIARFDLDNVETRIIEDGRIAYVQVRAMLPNRIAQEAAIMQRFLPRISNFEHLIIDLRGNRGGWNAGFHEILTSAIISSPATTRYMYFVRGGEMNMEFLSRAIHPWEYTRFDVFDGFVITEAGGIPVGNFSNRYSDFEDFEEFDYLVRTSSTVNPSWRPALRNVFDGQVWLLVDSVSASASEHVTALYIREEIAIVVGETTRGVPGNPGLGRIYFSLPNTGVIVRYEPGYIVDITGRSLTEGIPPHFQNRPGLDALETTLALIQEGAYRNFFD